MGHIAGFISGHEAFDRNIKTRNGTPIFLCDNFNITLTPDGSHIDSQLYPYDLMNATLTPGVRKLPSDLNQQLLKTIRNELGNSTTQQEDLPTARLTSAPLIALQNGDFTNTNPDDPQFGWNRRGAANLSLTVTDNAGAATRATLTVTVNNLAPTIKTLTGDTNINEGETANFSATATDPGNDNLTYTWDFGDGSSPDVGDSVSHRFTNSGNYAVKLTVTDSEGASTTNSLSVQVNNLAPTIINLEGDTDINEGQLANFSATATDPGNDNLTYTWNFGDGTQPKIGQNVSHIFTRGGTYNATVTVTDTKGASTTNSLTVQVNNLAPTITNLVGDTNINEGQTANFSATASDPGNNELTYTWDFGDGTQPKVGQNISHRFANSGNYTVTLTVTDNNGAKSASTLSVVVNNVAPTITNLIGDTNINRPPAKVLGDRII